MARRSTTKDELFDQNLAAGMGQLEAYTKAGFKGTKQAASVKANSERSKRRVRQIQNALIESQIIDKKWVMDELVDTYKASKASEEWNTARATLKDIGLELGMFIERKDIRVHAMFEKLSDEDVMQQVAEVQQKLLTIHDNNSCEDDT